MTDKFLDYSQFKNYLNCPLMWYEKYRQEYRKAPKLGQQYSPLVIGSLVHAGLEELRKTGTPRIPESAILEFDPTPEAYQEANSLILNYHDIFQDEQFTKYYCEEPIRFPLIPELDGLAKIDCYFNIAEPITIDQGLENIKLTLDPGWWIREYKTKAVSKDNGKYIASWRMNMQAAFQILALQNHINAPVNGVIVEVLEKPKKYEPKRKCKQCSESPPLQDWEPNGSEFMCPNCGNIQAIDTTDKRTSKQVNSYYRIMVQRSIEELEIAKQDIRLIARQISNIDKQDGEPILRNTEKCVDQIWGECDYFKAHSFNKLAYEVPSTFVKVDSIKYVGETKEPY